MIPKIIHYCWFGGKPLGELELKCIDSWKKYMPEYEIKLWNEENYDVNKIPYIRDAYKEKKYAFVSDYARFDILNQYGGIYFDTDVQVLKPLDDIVAKGPFLGQEAGIAKLAVAPGLGMASEANNHFFASVLEYYKSLNFYKQNGEYNLVTVVQYVTNLLLERGLKQTNEIQNVEGFFIYPPEYFCPMHSWTKEVNITDKSYTIHLYNASWLDEEQKKKNDEIKWLSKFLGYYVSYLIVTYKYQIKNQGLGSIFSFTLRKIKNKLEK